jgi:RND family efflux transporter MFP subunit
MTVPSWKHWLGIGLLAVALAGCNNGHDKNKTSPPADVVVTTPIIDEVLDYQDFTGRLSAIKMVEIRARVSGYVMDVPFKEGDTVRKDQLLYQIDARTYQADLNLAEANLKLAQADRNVWERNEHRDKNSLARRAISQEIYDQTVAALEKARANVAAMEASRDRAKLYLDYTKVVAPFDGRISRRYVDPGNLVNADQTVLTSLVTEDPLYVNFDVDERTFLDLIGSATSTGSSWFRGLRFPVRLRLANQDDFSITGTVDFLDNQVSPTSGTIRLRGEFKNPQGALKAGLFARVRMPTGNPYRAILVPDEALMSDQGRKYVFVVTRKKNQDGRDEDRVEYRKVLPGQTLTAKRKNDKGGVEDCVLRVLKNAVVADGEVKTGVREGERVIVQGQQRVRSGALVAARTQSPPGRPQQPLRDLIAGLHPGAGGKAAESGAQ